MIELRDYQKEGVAGIRAAYRDGAARALYVLPTGGGKTVLFTFIADATARRGDTMVFILVHRDQLIEQTSKALAQWGVRHGIISPDFAPESRHVQVASVWTLSRRLSFWQQATKNAKIFIIVDEAHHAVAGSWKKVMAAFPKAKALGVTATPERLDGKGLGMEFDAMVNGPTMADLISRGFLANMEVLAPDTRPDLTGLKKRGGDYDRTELEARMDKAAITGDVLQHYEKYVAGAPSIAFCTSVAHAEHVAERFRAAGYNAASVDGKLDRDEVKRRIRALGNGELNVLTSCELISEGIDVPSCQCAMLLRPTQSLTMYLQQVGRALRPKPDGSRAIILDHAGNSLVHGHPAAPREWTLADGFVKTTGQKKNGVAPKTCPKCFAIFRTGPRECPKCGADLVMRPPLPKEVEGELVALGIAFKGQDVRDVDYKALMKKCKTLPQLQAVARARGYEPKWATMMYAKKKAMRLKLQRGARS